MGQVFSTIIFILFAIIMIAVSIIGFNSLLLAQEQNNTIETPNEQILEPTLDNKLDDKLEIVLIITFSVILIVVLVVYIIYRIEERRRRLEEMDNPDGRNRYDDYDNTYTNRLNEGVYY